MSRLSGGRTPSLHEFATTGLLLIFAFGGYEVVPVPAGEARDPRRGVPFALIMTIAIATVVFTLVQFVALGTLPDLTTSKTPLADAAQLFLGGAGAALITVGAICSTGGNNMGQALSGSRNLYALAEQGDLPPFFGRVHSKFRTPANAVLFTSIVSFVLAVSGTFTLMAASSAITRLLVYLATCSATLRLRGPRLRIVCEAGSLRRSARTGDSDCGDPDRRHDSHRCDVDPAGHCRGSMRGRCRAIPDRRSQRP